jgi:hypothetical protein
MLQTNAVSTLPAPWRFLGDVRIYGVALLFEGTSEDTSDLDGRTEFTFLVPRGKMVSNSQKVRNTDEGGDFATIDMTVNNSIVEQIKEPLEVAAGIIYGVMDNGDLMCFRHDGRNDGTLTVGDIQWVQLPAANGHEQRDRRPAVIFQDDAYAGGLPVVLVVPPAEPYVLPERCSSGPRLRMDYCRPRSR